MKIDIITIFPGMFNAVLGESIIKRAQKKGKVNIDICVNKGCGAVHLDPGELEALTEDQGAISSVRSALRNVFK